MVGVADRGIGDHGGVGTVEVPVLVAVEPLGPSDFLHVGRPDASTGLAGRHSNHDESDYISKNYEFCTLALPTRSSFLWNSRSNEFRKASTTTAWMAPQTTAGD